MRAPGEDLGCMCGRQARLGAGAVKLGAARTVRDLGCSVGDWSCSEGSSEAGACSDCQRQRPGLQGL